MDNKRTVIYSRGFVGAASEATYSSQPIKAGGMLTVFNFANREEMSHKVTNEMIVHYYNQMIQRQVQITDFAWREEVVRAIFRAFGHTDVLSWIRECENSPIFVQVHADFIADWIRYCTTGKRNLPINTWERMVGAEVANPNSPALVCEDCIKMLPSGYSHTLNAMTPRSNMANMISGSLSRPGGFTDLLTTCYVLFGDTK